MKIFLRIAIGIFFAFSVYAGDVDSPENTMDNPSFKMQKKHGDGRVYVPKEVWLEIFGHAIDDGRDGYKTLVYLSRICKEFNKYLQEYLAPFSIRLKSEPDEPDPKNDQLLDFIKELETLHPMKSRRSKSLFTNLQKSYISGFIDSDYYALNFKELLDELIKLVKEYDEYHSSGKNAKYSIPAKNLLKIHTKEYIKRNLKNMRIAYVLSRERYHVYLGDSEYPKNVDGYLELFFPDFSLNKNDEQTVFLTMIFLEQNPGILCLSPFMGSWLICFEKYFEDNFHLKLSENNSNFSENEIYKQDKNKLENGLKILELFPDNLSPTNTEFYGLFNKWLNYCRRVNELYSRIDKEKSIKWMKSVLLRSDYMLTWRGKFSRIMSMPLNDLEKNTSLEVLIGLYEVSKYLKDQKKQLTYARYFLDRIAQFKRNGFVVTNALKTYGNEFFVLIILQDVIDKNDYSIAKSIGDLTEFFNKEMPHVFKTIISIFLGAHYQNLGEDSNAKRCKNIALLAYEEVQDKKELINRIDEYLNQYSNDKTQFIKDFMASIDGMKIKID